LKHFWLQLLNVKGSRYHPTYNESKNVQMLVPRIFGHLEDVDILIVDDYSPDGTEQVITQMKDCYPRLFLECGNIKGRLGAAYRRGFEWALDRDYQIVVEMDADMSHRVRDLQNMITFYKANKFDLIIGSRWIKGGQVENWSTRRILLSKYGNRYVRLVLGLKVMDSTSGFRIYSTDVLRRIRLNEIRSEGYCFQIEMAYIVSNVGGSIAETPIVFRDRVFGSSKMSIKIVFEAVLLVTYWGLKRVLTNIKLTK